MRLDNELPRRDRWNKPLNGQPTYLTACPQSCVKFWNALLFLKIFILVCWNGFWSIREREIYMMWKVVNATGLI